MMNFEPGDYFKEHSHENVRGKVVIDTAESLPGHGPAYRMAEKDLTTETWRAYWLPADQLHDELNLGAVEQKGNIGPDKVEQVKNNIEGVEPAEPVRLGDVLPDSHVQAFTNTEG